MLATLAFPRLTVVKAGATKDQEVCFVKSSDYVIANRTGSRDLRRLVSLEQSINHSLCHR